MEALEYANISKRLYSESAGDHQEKLPKAPNKFNSQTIENHYGNVSNDFELSNVFEEVVKKILLSLDTGKAAGVLLEQIPAKFLKEGAEELVLTLRNIINLSVKLSTFPDECKIAKLKPIFKKGARTVPKI